MKTFASLILATLLLALLAATAVAQDFPPWETYGQISPDRVLAERVSEGYFQTGFAPYTETGPLAYGTVSLQFAPDRALYERTRAGYFGAPVFAPYSFEGRYAFGTVHTQIPPERVLAERNGTDF